MRQKCIWQLLHWFDWNEPTKYYAFASCDMWIFQYSQTWSLLCFISWQKQQLKTQNIIHPPPPSQTGATSGSSGQLWHLKIGQRRVKNRGLQLSIIHRIEGLFCWWPHFWTGPALLLRRGWWRRIHRGRRRGWVWWRGWCRGSPSGRWTAATWRAVASAQPSPSGSSPRPPRPTPPRAPSWGSVDSSWKLVIRRLMDCVEGSPSHCYSHSLSKDPTPPRTLPEQRVSKPKKINLTSSSSFLTLWSWRVMKVVLTMLYSRGGSVHRLTTMVTSPVVMKRPAAKYM